MGIAAIEQRFLAALAIADFLYVYTQGNYVGPSTALEIGWALGAEPPKPIYTAESIAETLAEDDLEHQAYLSTRLAVASIADAVHIEQTRRVSAASEPI